MSAGHVLTVHFDEGDSEYLTLECLLSGTDRPCAVISCPRTPRDVDRWVDECKAKFGLAPRRRETGEEEPDD